jgi:hypothetical protein
MRGNFLPRSFSRGKKPFLIISAAIFIVAFITALILTITDVAVSGTETALLESENTARKLNAALLSEFLWADRQEQPKERTLFLRKDAPPPALWNLKRWPVGAEVFFASRGKNAALVRETKASELEFVTIDVAKFFSKNIGKDNHVEWLFADSGITEASSLAATESSQAENSWLKRNYTAASAMVPGTNTIVRRYFERSYLAPLMQKSLWISFGVVAVGCGVLALSLEMFGGLQQKPITKGSSPLPAPGPLKDKKFFIERLDACIRNDLIERQCIVFLSPDKSESKSAREDEIFQSAIQEELTKICRHGPLPATIDTSLFAIHCPNQNARRTLEFTARLIESISLRPEIRLRTPRVTFSAVVAEFHRNEDSQQERTEGIASKLLDNALTALHQVKARGGDSLVFANSFDPNEGESSCEPS